jgi:hypothetical protein
MAGIFGILSLGASLLGGISQKKASDKAADAARAAGEFNAKIIERDIDLLERQRQIFNSNFLVQADRSKRAFERDVQGAVRAGFGFAGFDMSQGSPLQILRENAREFQYEQDVNEFNRQITNMQISDEQESVRLNAELSRMGGQAQASGLRAAGTASLIGSIGQAAAIGYEYKKFGR